MPLFPNFISSWKVMSLIVSSNLYYNLRNMLKLHTAFIGNTFNCQSYSKHITCTHLNVCLIEKLIDGLILRDILRPNSM